MVMESYQRGLRQKGMFTVIYDGLDVSLVKSFKLPDLEREIMKFGSAGTFWDNKEPGRLVVSQFEIEKGIPSDEKDEFSWKLLISGIYTPSVARKDLVVRELAMDRETAIRQWTMVKPIFAKLPGLEFDGMSSEPVLEKIIGECDYVNFEVL